MGKDVDAALTRPAIECRGESEGSKTDVSRSLGDNERDVEKGGDGVSDGESLLRLLYLFRITLCGLLSAQRCASRASQALSSEVQTSRRS